MQWTVHGERSLYESEWVNLRLVDVEVPEGPRFDHHVVRMPRPAAGTVVFDPARGVLLLWRHRFITDNWGWEIPAGRVDEGETPMQAAYRETLEESGWRPSPLRPLTSYRPAPGLVDQHFHLFLADGAEHVGEPLDASESERVEWVPVDRLRDEIREGRVVDGFTLVGVLHGLAFGQLH
jgi:8-oxo-dGTP pyrophosphatase MutT (NUDIX family)